MANFGCYSRERIDLGGGISYQHRCTSHKFNRDETTLIELGQRAMSHLLLSAWYPEQHALDELETLTYEVDDADPFAGIVDVETNDGWDG